MVRRDRLVLPPKSDGFEGFITDGRIDWFNMLYQVQLGQEKGPRFGSFVAVYGITNAVNMIDGALARSA